MTPLLVAGMVLLSAVPFLSAQEVGPQVDSPRPANVAEAEHREQIAARVRLEEDKPKQILFGDTHVHTTYSVDAFFASLPIMQGQGRGAYPPSDACDFARYCSALDFYTLTDHAEAYTPQHWKNAKESIRQCNAVAGDPDNPDLVAFLGFEWTQVGRTPEEHFGHQNVMFLGTEEDEVPKRPIASGGATSSALRGSMAGQVAMMGVIDQENRDVYNELAGMMRTMGATPDCAEGVHTRELPEDCYEVAETPARLFEKLDQWGFDSIVIPHGTTWGFYTPPGTTFDKHLKAANFDPEKQTMIEIYSGHGNSEQYREWRAIRWDEDGNPYCPEPTDDYLPQCWQAGEIIRDRALASGFSEEEADARAAQARQNFVEQAAVAAYLTVPGATMDEWLDAGQARDMFIPAFNYRPAESVQYSIAIANFDDPENPLRRTWGFIGSSDNHRARPGTGYKETDRHRTTEGSGPHSERWRRLIGGEPVYPAAQSITIDEAIQGKSGFQLLELERQASFFATGGLAAVHSAGRNREAVWGAMKRKEVYATSGDRILLWFDLVNGPDGRAPMGAEVAMDEAPRFEVRAVGAFKQLPGCPDYTTSALTPQQLADLCRGECYNPSDERKLITRIEVIRISPQQSADEDVGDLIEDPWKVFECEPDPAGCAVEFEDPEYAESERGFLYYVRAIEEPSPAINGENLRTTYNREGEPVSVNPCYGDMRTRAEDDCLEMVEERAWSSPIYLSRKG